MKNSLSFVIPLFNEEENIVELYHNLKNSIEKDLKNYLTEIIFINDGSTDNSLNILKKLSYKDSSIKIISFKNNLGKATALNEGFQKAKGDLIITMDADLQDGVENIQILINKLNKGFDLVVGWRKKRSDPPTKTIPSKAFNFLIGKISSIPLHDFNSGLKIMKREVAKTIHLKGELHRLLPVLAAEKGYKVSEIPTHHYPRKHGSSKYGWGRLMVGFFATLFILTTKRFKY